MKTKIILFLLSIITISASAQNLTLADLQKLCKLTDWETGANILTHKGWEYHSSKRGDSYDFSTITYAYGKNHWYGEEDRATAWFNFSTHNNRVEQITYQPTNSAYKNIKASLASNGYQKINNEIHNEYISTCYSNSSFILEIQTSTQKLEFSEHTTVSYLIRLIRKGGFYDEDNGEKVFYHQDSNIIKEQCTLKNGKRHGKSYNYSEDGKLNSIITFINGEMTGSATWYHENEEPSVIGNFINGKENGLFTVYDMFGNKTKELNYKNGVRNGKYTLFNSDGGILETGNYIDNKKNGLITTYNNYGAKEVESYYKNGERNGKYTEYVYDDKKLFAMTIGNCIKDEMDGLWETKVLMDGTWKPFGYSNYKNGIKNGKAKEFISRDSIIYCNYTNGVLNGKYQIKSLTFESRLFGADTLIFNEENLKTIVDGEYSMGNKIGHWEYYDIWKGNTSPIYEGDYANNLETGKWKTYSHYTETNNITYNTTCNIEKTQLSIIENFHNGKLEGKYVKFKDKSNLPFKDSIEYIGYYHDGKRHGNFEHHNNDGLIDIISNYENDVIRSSTIITDSTEVIDNILDIKQNIMYGEETTLIKKNIFEKNYRNGTYLIPFTAILDTRKIVSNRSYEYPSDISYDNPFYIYDCKRKHIGAIKFYNNDNKLIIYAIYNEGEINLWHFNYFDQNVSFDYNDDFQKIIFKTYDTNDPYSGKFECKIMLNGKETKGVFKIKKSNLKEIRYYDIQSGVLIMEKKY